MSSFVGWDEPTEKKKGAGAGQFLKLKAGNKYKIRLVSNAVRYFQHWEPVICRSPGIDAAGTVLDPLMQQNYQPKERYAIWVLDRDDENKLKVMDFPPVLYEQFAEWKADFNEPPGGANGPDWSIKLEMRGNDPRKTQYKANRLDKAPFTGEEIERIKAGIMVNGVATSLKDKLADLRKAHTAQEIRDMISAKGDPTGPTGGGKPAVVPTGTTEANLDKPAPKAAATTPTAAPKGFDF